MDLQTELLQKILDVVTLIAEPQIAQRDERQRNALSEIVGKGKLKAKAVCLMDGTKPQAAICKEAGIDAGALSRLTKALRKAGLLGDDEKLKLTFSLPPGFMTDKEK
jgi:hypothetical protein